MSERMGNGSIQVSITVYPANEGCKRYDGAITRTIEIDHLGGVTEMERVAYDMGSMVSSTIGAMIGTLHQRAEAEAKAAAEALAGEGMGIGLAGAEAEYTITETGFKRKEQTTE